MMLSERRKVVFVLQNNDAFPATLPLSHFRRFPNIDIKEQGRMANDENAASAPAALWFY